MYKKLIIDTGNTLQKLAVFEDKELVLKKTLQGIDPVSLRKFIDDHGPFYGSIHASVVEIKPEIEAVLMQAGKYMPLTHETTLPFKNLYNTPETLGKDRIAAVAGAWSLFPANNILIIDAGTCITYDFINKSGEYPGGAISPGILMRLKAMHTFTGKLPLIQADGFDGLIGRSTAESMLSGVYNGVVAEIKDSIRAYSEKYDNLKTIITGGDHEFLFNKLKINIFAAPDLVLLGLNEIFDFNDNVG